MADDKPWDEEEENLRMYKSLAGAKPNPMAKVFVDAQSAATKAAVPTKEEADGWKQRHPQLAALAQKAFDAYTRKAAELSAQSKDRHPIGEDLSKWYVKKTASPLPGYVPPKGTLDRKVADAAMAVDDWADPKAAEMRKQFVAQGRPAPAGLEVDENGKITGGNIAAATRSTATTLPRKPPVEQERIERTYQAMTKAGAKPMPLPKKTGKMTDDEAARLMKRGDAMMANIKAQREGLDMAGPAVKRISDGTAETGYNTVLTPGAEKAYLAWKERGPAKEDTGIDYDHRGFWAAGEVTGDNGHGTDQFKKPNHPTFSDESQYAELAPDEAGHWGPGEENYIEKGPPAWLRQEVRGRGDVK